MIKEPPTSLMLRCNILTYELGSAIKCIVYAERFPMDRVKWLASAKAELADTLMTFRKLITELGVDEHEIRQLGEQRLRERYAEFEKMGWVEA